MMCPGNGWECGKRITSVIHFIVRSNICFIVIFMGEITGKNEPRTNALRFKTISRQQQT